MDQDKISELIKQLVRENRVALKNVVVGLPSNKVFATVITTPKLDNAQLAKAIRYQAEQYIPMALDQVKLDWAVIDQSKDGKQLEVLLVAAPVLGGRPLHGDLWRRPGWSRWRWSQRYRGGPGADAAEHLAVAMVDFGSLDSDISIVWNNAPRLIRSVSVGGLTLVRGGAKPWPR
jgi:type IV pilus assembly protein PilM